MQIESVIDIAEVDARDFANAGKPVPQSAAVDMQGGGRFRIVATTFQVMAERKNQLGVFALVVVEECSQPFAYESFDRASAVRGIERNGVSFEPSRDANRKTSGALRISHAYSDGLD